MAIDIVVVRGTGSHQGPDIVDPYITTVQAARARGLYELEAQATGLQPQDIEIPYLSGVRPGDIVQVGDADLAELWYGKVVSVTHTASSVDRITRLRIMRSTEFMVG